jgi:hypothetical protein
MKEIYRITIRGKILESRDLRKLLAMAVTEKREIDRRLEISSACRASLIGSPRLLPVVTAKISGLEQAG